MAPTDFSKCFTTIVFTRSHTGCKDYRVSHSHTDSSSLGGSLGFSILPKGTLKC